MSTKIFNSILHSFCQGSHTKSGPTIRLHLNRYVFTSRMLPLIVVMSLIVAMGGLGKWQLNRADYKKYLENTLQKRQSLPARTLPELTSQSDIEYYPVQISGYFDNDHQILLDNQILDHKVGYQVFTPFIPDNSNDQRVLLVNRGWIARNRDRSHLPYLKPVLGKQTIKGLAKTPPQKIFVLTNRYDTLIWPFLVQALDLMQITNALQHSTYPFVLLLDPAQKHGFARKWRVTGLSTHKHYGYAIQWFSLSITLAIIYAFINIRRVSDGKTK